MYKRQSYNSFSGSGFSFDGVANIAQPPAIALTATETLIFTLNFDVSMAASPGDFYDINIISTGAPADVLFDITGDNIGTPADADLSNSAGRIEIISSIPEPGTATLLLVSCIAAAGFRRRNC